MPQVPDVAATFRLLADLLTSACGIDVLAWQSSDLLFVWPESQRSGFDEAARTSPPGGKRTARFDSEAGCLTAIRNANMPLEEATLQRLREASEVLARETLQRRAGDRQQAERNYRRDEDLADRDLRELAGESPSMRGVRQAIRQAAPTDATVLILGETGTGKELVARAIHQLSPRRNQLLVQVNCGALSPALVTSELFGHEQGAFTGAAKQRIGRLELADGGTLFLDEIGEMPPDAQVLLLRALQQRTLERVGGTKSIAIDVRIVAATHRDLESAVEAKAFRADLYYRLNVVPLRVPPLRERREDIPLLIRHFLQQTTRKLGRTFAPLTSETIRLLTQYEWPGNVRELQNVIERAAVLSPEERLLVDPAWFRSPASTLNPDGTWQERERAAIVEALSRAKGRIYGVGGAAAILGLRPTTLYGKMKKLGIPRDAE